MNLSEYNEYNAQRDTFERLHALGAHVLKVEAVRLAGKVYVTATVNMSASAPEAKAVMLLPLKVTDYKLFIRFAPMAVRKAV